MHAKFFNWLELHDTVYFIIFVFPFDSRKLQRKLQSGAISQADINLIWPFFCPIEEIFNSVVQFSESEQDKVLTNTIPLNRIETNNSSHDVRQSIPLFADMTRDSERVPMNDPKDNIRNEQSEHLARIRLLNKAENRQLLDMSRKRKRSLEIEDVLENSFKIQQDIKLSLSKFHDDQMAALNQLIELQQESNNIQSKILKLILDKSI